MNDDKIFIQDFDRDNKKGLIIVDDDSDTIIEQDAPASDTKYSSPQRQKELRNPINGDG